MDNGDSYVPIERQMVAARRRASAAGAERANDVAAARDWFVFCGDSLAWLSDDRYVSLPHCVVVDRPRGAANDGNDVAVEVRRAACACNCKPCGASNAISLS